MVRVSKEEIADLNRRIIAKNIDRDPVGRRLTPEAREAAIEAGMDAFHGNIGNGEASDIGIRSVTKKLFKE